MEPSNDCELLDSRALYGRGDATRANRLAVGVESTGRAVAFWSAVILPFVAIGVASTGLGSLDRWALFGSLVVVNVLALYVGHSYCTDRLS